MMGAEFRTDANLNFNHQQSIQDINAAFYLSVNECCMPELQLAHPRKRQRMEPLQSNGISQPQLKRLKLNYPTTRSQPPAFWDNLSKIWLTKRALRELNRRNSQSASNQSRSQYRQARRPVTRNFLAELKETGRITQSTSDFLRHCEPETLKDIKRFARNGGPDFSDLKNVNITKYPSTNAETDNILKLPESIESLNHIMNSNQSNSQNRKRKENSTSISNTKPITNTTKNTGPYDRNFQQNLIDGGVYPHVDEYSDGRIPAKPNNWEEIKQRLIQPRSSLSSSKFSEEAHEKFIRADAHAFKEKQVTTSVIPIIEGEIRDAKCVSGGIPFTNLDHLTDGTLVPGNPDLYYGARPEQLGRRVRDELSGHIIPSTQDDLPIAPNFLLAVKGPDGSLAVAGRQASYDGVLGARAIYSLQSYGEDEPVYDNNAYTITSIYHGGTLKMYTSHPIQPTNSLENRPEYFMHQLNAWSMTGNTESFRQGATAYRNARDWANEQRDNAIKRANERIRDDQAGITAVDANFTNGASLDETYTIAALSPESQSSLNRDSNTTADPPESETSTDEFAPPTLAKAIRWLQIWRPSWPERTNTN